MKTVKVVVLVTSVACVATLQAQDAKTNKVAELETVTYREMILTNGVFGHETEVHPLAEDYRVIVLHPEEEMPSPSESKSEALPVVDTNGPSFNNLFVYETLGFQHEAISTNRSWKSAGDPEKKPTQILVIERMDPAKGTTPEMLLVREYSFGSTNQPPRWHEWLHPKMFLNKWAEFWTTETNATPVVLILIPF